MLVFNGVYLYVQYGEVDVNVQRGKKVNKVTRRSATVTAVKDEKTEVPMRDREHLSVGVAFCSTKDNFSRAKGRKLATARCVAGLGWDEETRKQFWEVYNNKFKKEE